jgi:multicomponent Na+:H+ antiporter subunit G
VSLVHILALLVLAAGSFFLLVGSIGLIRFPDFYSRCHATGKSDTLGVMLVILGLILIEGFTLNSAKLLLILTFVGLTNPTATHALAQAAFRFGLKVWFRKPPSVRPADEPPQES